MNSAAWTRNISLGLLLAGLAAAPPAGAESPKPLTRFGHRFFPEANQKDLALAGIYRQSGRKVLLRREAAAAFKAMTKAARAQGVGIIPISGFRPVQYQRQLFERATGRYGSEEKAARWVAPPGYSEHATGWSLDLGEEPTPSSDVEVAFENTKAFAWLRQNAAAHHFELSFPKNNSQGVNYEPWHWRFVGAPASKTLFHPD